MCFSAQASFAASAALIFISALCFKKAQNNNQRLLASGPLFFGIQQFLEGLVWVTLNSGDSSSAVHMCSVYGFLSFAYIFWPLYVPFTTYLFEKDPMRKKIELGLLALGTLIATTGLLTLTLFDYTANALDHHIVYEYIPSFTTLSASTLTTIQYILLALYMLVIVGSMVISTTPYMWLMGLLIALGFIVAQILFTVAFGSVWCFFGALASMVIYYILTKLHKK